MTRLDLTGQRYGRLRVITRAEGRSPSRRVLWECLCDCGQSATLPTDSLRSGNTRSCGCLHRQRCAERAAQRNSKIVVSYAGMHRRLLRLRGHARNYACPCGSPAAEWSYDGSDPDELVDDRGRPYSLGPNHYVPRCVSCHRAHDSRANRARAATEGATA